jgi:CheY-like chemotaxis protein
VDDEPLVRRAIHRELRRLGRKLGPDLRLTVHLFGDARDALGKIPELEPDLIISDNSMPGMLGIDFLFEVRANYPGIRTMMISAGAVNGEVQRAADRGDIDEVLSKPWDDEQLFALVRSLLDIQDS